jgi:protein gp37
VKGKSDWWDLTSNPTVGCELVPGDPTCLNCYAPAMAAGLQLSAGRERRVVPQYVGLTREVKERHYWTGKVNIVPRGHLEWSQLRDFPGVPHPLLERQYGPGMPSLIFIGSMGDLIIDKVPDAIISKVVGSLCLNDHVIGLILSKRSARMREFFTAPRSPERLRRAQERVWLGFSGGTQAGFDSRWAEMRELAARGWTVFASLAPLLEPVVLPPDFLRLAAWTIVSGEQPVEGRWRDMDPRWARRVRDQCRESGTAYKAIGRQAANPARLAD